MSPSMRRAWIEIGGRRAAHQAGRVALHAEGVDRNLDKATELERDNVALHAEGVDRNSERLGVSRSHYARRPPCGGRG